MILALRVVLIIMIVFYLAIIMNYMRKKTMNIQYALGWLFSGAVMLVITVFPNLITYFANLFGIVDETNLIFLIEGAFVLLIMLSLTSVISAQNEMSRKMVQHLAILEKRVRELEEKNEAD